MPPNKPFLLLDAMGVLYQSGDDVGELLVPFVQQHNTRATTEEIEKHYHQASLGAISAAQFWAAVGLDPTREDDYLSQHQLTEGLLPFLQWAKSVQINIGCLSNDLSRWSVKLRERLGLTELITPWIISGDMGTRKPDPRIYLPVLAATKLKAEQIVFVDDRRKNIETAANLGMKTVLFDTSQGGRHAFEALKAYLSSLLNKNNDIKHNA